MGLPPSGDKRHLVGPNDLSDPTILPVLLVCFYLDGVCINGWYSSEQDVFLVLPERAGEPDCKDGFKVTRRGSPEYHGAMVTIEKFKDDLPTGGTPNMDRLKDPYVQSLRRLRR